MFTPPNLTIALVMIITSAICWGSWANTYKGVKNYRFELFYWDYAIGIFLCSLMYALTMGSSGHDASSFLNNVRLANPTDICYQIIGGVIFNLANLLLVAAIDMAGLAMAFPISIGIALVVGVITSYVQEPKGNGGWLAAGVVLAVIAIILDGKAYGSIATTDRAASKKSVVTCIVSGVLMGLWPLFTTRTMPHMVNGQTVGSLSPYTAAVFMTLGALLSCLVWNVYFMRKPLVGNPVSFSGFFSGPPSGHLLGLAGGFVWGTGTVFDLVAAKYTGMAISYAIGQAAPMVAALWGLLVWKEFANAGSRAKLYLVLMFIFYCVAILLVAHATG
jgi:glucose uptake protein